MIIGPAGSPYWVRKRHCWWRHYLGLILRPDLSQNGFFVFDIFLREYHNRYHEFRKTNEVCHGE